MGCLGVSMGRRMGFLVVAIIISVLPYEPAAAHDQGECRYCGQESYSYQWRNYHAVGSSCGGEVNSKYVTSIESILWAAGQISDINTPDQVFDNSSANWLSTYQGYHGLGSDACAGYYTWDNMQNSGHYVSQLGAYFYHLESSGVSCCGTYYKWKEKKDASGGNRIANYHKYNAAGGGIYGGEWGCWHLLSLTNNQTGSQRNFSHTRVDHDGDGQCD